MWIRLFTFLLALLSLLAVRATEVDSLQYVLRQNDLADSLRLQTLAKLSRALRFSKPDSAIMYAEIGLRLAQDAQLSKYEGSAHNSLGIIYGWVKSDYPKALRHFEQALRIRKAIAEEKGDYYAVAVAATLNNTATVEKFRGRYSRALELYLEAYPIYTRLNNKKGLASCSNNIGELYKKQDRFEQALDYYNRALNLYQELDNENYQAVVLSNIANIQKIKGSYEQALGRYLQVLEIFQRNKVDRYIPSILHNLGVLYEETGELDKAYRSYQEAMQLLRQSNNTEGLVKPLNSLAGLLLKRAEPEKALAYARESLALAEASGSYVQLRDATSILSETHAELGNYREAYRFATAFKTYSDSLVNAEKSREMGRLEAEAEFRQRELEREKQALRQEKEISRQKLIRNVLFAGSIVLVIFLFLAYRGYRIKQQDNKEIAAKNKLLVNKNKVITDGMTYAKSIQKAMLPLKEEMAAAFPQNFVLLRPRDLVSGDFYWVYRNEERVVLAVVDCTGHGVPGAFMSMMGNDLLNETVTRRGIYRPDLILNELDAGVRRALKQNATRNEDGMDVSIMTYYPKENKLQFAGARHPLVYFEQHEDEPARGILKGDRMSVGGSHINEPESFRLKEIWLRYPTTCYLYSDGYVDQFGGPENKKVRRKLFLKLLWELQEKPELSDQKAHLSQFMDNWMGDTYNQIDDILVVGVRLEPQ